jgi:hypothetical protein
MYKKKEDKVFYHEYILWDFYFLYIILYSNKESGIKI